MKELQRIIEKNNPQGIPEYLSLYRKLQKELKAREVVFEKSLKIAILFSSTVKGLAETIAVKCFSIGIKPEIYQCGYGQYSQEIFDPNSQLYAFNADLIVFGLDLISLLGERYFAPYSLTDKERKEETRKDFESLINLINTLKTRSSGKIVLNDFEVPNYSPLGLLENKQDFGFIESVRTLNYELKKTFKLDSQVYIFEYDSFAAGVGKSQFLDEKMYYLGDIKIAMQHIPALCDEYMAFVKSIAAANRKCIVLDLDNTLWGGIIGEDGIDGIKLGPTSEGRPFWEFQKYLLALFNRGIILAVNSKNNLEDAIKAIREHPYMILREEHFAAMKINWNDKISNMRAIAEEINIGLSSMVFFDDDKQNRAMIKSALPEVMVVDLPEDSSLYLKTILQINDFNSLHLTEEDRQKGRMYAQQRGRNEVKKAATDISEYLESLEMKVTIYRDSLRHVPRISQLTLKTNQFNLTTRRFQEESIREFVESDDFLVLCVKVEDRFGDNGVSGVAIVEKGKEAWNIKSFLLSCRIIGRNIEQILLKQIIELAVESAIEKVRGEFILTSKNAPARSFYEQNGFAKVSANGAEESWEFDTRKAFSFPDYIKVIKG